MRSLTIALVSALACLAQDAKTPARTATFEVRHELKVTLPEGAQKVRVWFALPQEDPCSNISEIKIDCPLRARIETNADGIRMLYVEKEKPEGKEITIVETFTLTRTEQRGFPDPKKALPLSKEEQSKMAPCLAANQNVVIDEKIKKLADEIVGTETNPVVAARKIYDWVLANIDYWVKDPNHKKASPVGSSEYCLAHKTGNCTDFHSLWTALARAKGIPTRMVYGSFFKKELDGQDKDQSYHCWPEFYATGIGWIPHDVAVADLFVGDFEITKDNDEKVRLTTADGYAGKDAAKVDYYFGNIDERRVVWSTGRDLTLAPAQEGGPVNALAKAHVEVDGKVLPEKTGWTRKLTYKEVK